MRRSALGVCVLATLALSCGGSDGDTASGRDDVGDDGAVCGDGVCDASEAGGCPEDCEMSCTGEACGPVCGDGVCEGEEESCPADCAECGDDVCDVGEDESCPQDCVVCGDGVCEAGEDPVSCAEDCDAVCGNEIVEGWEQCDGSPAGVTCADNPFSPNVDGGPVLCTDECLLSFENCWCDPSRRDCGLIPSNPECGPSAWVRSIQIPPASVECCFDFNGDGSVDNGLRLVSDALRGAVDVDVQQAIDDAIEDEVLSLLFDFYQIPDSLADGDVRLQVLLGSNDLDEDGEVDQDIEERETGNGVFRVLPESFTSDGPMIQINNGSLEGGMLEAGPAEFAVTIPIPDILVLDITIQNAILEAPIREEEGGIWTTDDDIDLDGAVTTFGGMRLGGVIPLDQIFDILNELSHECDECAGLVGSDLLMFGEDLDSYVAECTQDVSGASACTDRDSVFCPALPTLCSAAPLLAGAADVDTNGNGIDESLSVGLRLSLVPATIDDPIGCE